MDFFQSQHNAKRKTARLVLLFIAAVLSLIVITNLLVMIAFGLLGTGAVGSVSTQQIDWNVFALTSIAIIVIVTGGALYKMAALAGGGARVAEMLNGRLLLPQSSDFHERRVLNVVEEMALASGTPIPPVYLLEEPGINAFAAGYAPDDAVIGVTRGAIESLNRDELQGVIAHEFSHILHGDMRINIRLIAILNGIMILGLIGEGLLRGSSRSRRSKDAGGVIFLGLGLLVIGYVGVLFGNLIKAAVSRQREFLADASSVQFTRNPEGIGHALMRIAVHTERSYLANPKSMEISHALFEEPRRSFLGGMMATHPPLTDRIKAVLPNWDGRYELPALRTDASETEPADNAGKGRESAPSLAAATVAAAVAETLIAQSGQVTSENTDRARNILRRIPDELGDVAREPAGARAVIYCLVMEREPGLRAQQLALLQEVADFGVYEEVLKLESAVGSLAAELRLPLINIALSALRQLTPGQYQRFRSNLGRLVLLDRKRSLFEWSLQKIVTRHLDAVFLGRPPRSIGQRDLTSLREEIGTVLWSLAYAGGSADIDLAISKAYEALNMDSPGAIPRDRLTLQELDAALDSLGQMKPLQKPALLKACATCINADGRVTVAEMELFRAIADTLDCPMPPLPAPG